MPADDFLQVWIGWRRHKWAVWWPICSSYSEEECRAILYLHLPDLDDPDGENLVLPAGDRPLS